MLGFVKNLLGTSDHRDANCWVPVNLKIPLMSKSTLNKTNVISNITSMIIRCSSSRKKWSRAGIGGLWYVKFPSSWKFAENMETFASFQTLITIQNLHHSFLTTGGLVYRNPTVEAETCSSLFRENTICILCSKVPEVDQVLSCWCFQCSRKLPTLSKS